MQPFAATIRTAGFGTLNWPFNGPPREIRIEVGLAHACRLTNMLQDPSRVTFDGYQRFIANPGIFVWDKDGRIVGFSAADPRHGSIWALCMEMAGAHCTTVITTGRSLLVILSTMTKLSWPMNPDTGL
jgi:hypothetical protein